MVLFRNSSPIKYFLANYYKTNVFKILILEVMFHCLIAYPKANTNFKFIFQSDVLYYK